MIDGNGLHPLDDKIKSISAAPAPKKFDRIEIVFRDAAVIFSILRQSGNYH